MGGARSNGSEVTETHSMFQEAQIDRPGEQEQQQGHGAGDEGSDGLASSQNDGTASDPHTSEVPAGVRVEQMPVGTEDDEDDDATATTQHKSDNATVLKSLFDGGGTDKDAFGGVKGAISHDRIMETEAVDKVIVRQKAEQIAQEAIAGLKASSHQRSRSSITTPTWTGRHGEAGMPRPQLNPKPDNQHPGASFAGGPGAAGGNGSDRGMAELRMGKELVDFLQKQGGSAPSGSIIAHFQRGVTVAKVGSEVRTAREMELFKQLLKHVARLDKQSKEWRLRDEA